MAQEGALDVVFVVDETGSMGGQIAVVQNNIRSMVDSIRAMASDSMFGLIGYRDHSDKWVVTVHTQLTRKISEVKRGVKEMAAEGGGDYPVKRLWLMRTIPPLVRLDWRASSTKTAVFIADAPPHGVGGGGDSYPNGCPCGESWSEQIESCREVGIIVHSVSCGGLKEKDLFKKIASKTWGQYFELSSVSALPDLITGVVQCDLDRQKVSRAVLAKVSDPHIMSTLQQLTTEGARIRFLLDAFLEENMRIKTKLRKADAPVTERKVTKAEVEQAVAYVRRSGASEQFCELFPIAGSVPMISQGGLYSKESKEPLTLKSVEAHTSIVGFLCEVEIVQVYHNTTGVAVDAAFKFPTDETVALCSFTAETEGRCISAQCVEKADSTGPNGPSKSPGGAQAGKDMLQGKKSSAFRMSVGVIQPDRSMTVRLSYVSALETSGSVTRFVLPVSIVPAIKKKSNFEGESSSSACYDFQILSKIELPVEIVPNTITSPTHSIVVVYDGPRASVRLQEVGKEMTSNFILLIPNNNPALNNFSCVESWPDSETLPLAAVASFFPNLPESDFDQKKTVDIYLILDCSASMSGGQIKQAIAAAHHWLNCVGTKCPAATRFNVVSFGTDKQFLFPGAPHPVTPEGIESAHGYVKNLSASMGGSQLAGVLNEIMTQRLAETPQIAFLLTDGAIGQPDILLRKMKSSPEKYPTFFPIGIGQGVSTAFIRSAARVTGGALELCALGEPIQIKVDIQLARVFSSLSAPQSDWIASVVHHIPVTLPPAVPQCRTSSFAFILPDTLQSIKCPNGHTLEPIKAIPANETFNCKSCHGTDNAPELQCSQCKYDICPNCISKWGRSVCLSGNFRGTPLSTSIPLDINTPTHGRIIHRLCAKESIQQLEASISGKDHDPAVKQAIINLSTTYNLASSYTTYRALDGSSPVTPEQAQSVPTVSTTSSAEVSSVAKTAKTAKTKTAKMARGRSTAVREEKECMAKSEKKRARTPSRSCSSSSSSSGSGYCGSLSGSPEPRKKVVMEEGSKRKRSVSPRLKRKVSRSDSGSYSRSDTGSGSGGDDSERDRKKKVSKIKLPAKKGKRTTSSSSTTSSGSRKAVTKITFKPKASGSEGSSGSSKHTKPTPAPASKPKAGSSVTSGSGSSGSHPAAKPTSAKMKGKAASSSSSVASGSEGSKGSKRKGKSPTPSTETSAAATTVPPAVMKKWKKLLTSLGLTKEEKSNKTVMDTIINAITEFLHKHSITATSYPTIAAAPAPSPPATTTIDLTVLSTEDWNLLVTELKASLKKHYFPYHENEFVSSGAGPMKQNQPLPIESPYKAIAPHVVDLQIIATQSQKVPIPQVAHKLGAVAFAIFPRDLVPNDSEGRGQAQNQPGLHADAPEDPSWRRHEQANGAGSAAPVNIGPAGKCNELRPNQHIVVSGYSSLATSHYLIASNSYQAASSAALPFIKAKTGVVGSFMYVIGGSSSSYPDEPEAWFQTYNISKDFSGPAPSSAWGTASSLWPSRLSGHSVVTYNNNLWVFGGVNGFGQVVNTLWCYDPDKITQVNASNPPPARRGHTAVVGIEKMWIFGGKDDTAVPAILYNDIWMYNFGFNNWTQIPVVNPIPEQREGHLSSIWSDYIYIYGGTGTQAYSNMWRFKFTDVGPQIISFVAKDPDNADALYGVNDVVTIVFDMETNTPAVSTTAEISSLLSFSACLGAQLVGSWKNASTLQIEITGKVFFDIKSSTRSLTRWQCGTAPAIGNLTVTVVGALYDYQYYRKGSTSTSPSLSGNWGQLKGPVMTSMIANDPDNQDIVLSNGDCIWITFDQMTDQSGSLTQQEVLKMFSFDKVLGSSFSGLWYSESIFVVSLLNVTGSTVQIGSCNVSIKGVILNKAQTSLPANGTIGPLIGNWGTRQGPTITSMVASDPDNGDAIFSAGDTITLTFSEPTNQPAVDTKSNVDALLTFTQSLGLNYTGKWETSSLLRLTIQNPLGGSPIISTTTATVKKAGNLKDQNNLSFPSNGTSPPLTGNWGTLSGPNITLLKATDPDNGDAIFSTGDVLVIVFNVDTTRPPVTTKAQVDSLIKFSSSLGTNYTGNWSTAKLYIKILDPSGGNPITGKFYINFTGGIQSSGYKSLVSYPQSPLLSGNWGTKGGPSIVSLIADDPDNQDGIYSTGDTLTLLFNEPTNTPYGLYLTRANIDSLFTFSESLGANYTGKWLNTTLLRITVVRPQGANPTIANLTVKCSSSSLKDSPGTSLPCNTSSPTAKGDWGTKAGPSITQLVASDPDNLDAIYGKGDIITLFFSEATNKQAVATKSNIDALLSFSQPIGDDYSGEWLNSASELVITINTPSVVGPDIGVLVVSIHPSANLRNAQNTSLPSNSSSPVLSGNWGTLTGPIITNFIASDPDNADALYSVGDALEIYFNMNTNQNPVSTKALVDATFYFSQNLGADYNAVWATPSCCIIRIASVASATPPAIGILTVRVQGDVRNNGSISLPSRSLSSPITGDWGTLAGPSILSITASDPDNQDCFFSNGDAITIIFSAATNMPSLSTKSVIDTVFTFSVSLGSSYSASWGATADVLVLTISNTTGSGNPAINSFTITLKSTQTRIKNAAETSLPSQGLSPTLVGNWGTLAGPVITSFVASDPDNRDGVFSVGDTITISFDTPTNSPLLSSKLAVDALFQFNQNLGDQYFGHWSTDSTVVITINGTVGATPPAVGYLICTVIGELYNKAYTSFPSNTTSGVLTGNWGLGPLCAYTDCQQCTANSTCGWCAESQRCFEGTSAGPLFASCTNWEYATCHSCAISTCTLCIADTGCGWCLDTHCQRGDSTSAWTTPCSSYSKSLCPALLISMVTPLLTSENGTSQVINIQLTSQPVSLVSVGISCNDSSEATVAPATLTFSPTSWNVVQSVWVTGVNDNIVDGSQPFSVNFFLTSSDPLFSGVTPPPLTGKNLDDDIPALHSSCLNPITSESGSSTSITLSLSCQPQFPVNITAQSNPISECIISPSRAIYTVATSLSPLVFTVTGVDDFVADGNTTCSLVFQSASLDPLFNNLVTTTFITNVDNDHSGVQVTPCPCTTSESGAVFDLGFKLDSQPTDLVTITCVSDDTSEGIIAGDAYLSPTTWNSWQYTQVIGQDDVIVDGNVYYTVQCSTTSSDPNYQSIPIAPISILNVDNDTPGITVVFSGNTTTESGTSIVASVQLNTMPADSVTVPFSLSDSTEASITPLPPLVFTTANWLTRQNIQITGLDDFVVDGTVLYTIKIGPATSSDTLYNSLAVTGSPFTLANSDNDHASISLQYTFPLVVSEGGQQASIGVSLTSQPLAGVTVSVSSNDTTECVLSTSIISFTPGNWATVQFLTVFGVDDPYVDGNVTCKLVFGPSSSLDSLYNNLKEEVTVINTDNDTIGMQVVRTSSVSQTSESGSSVTFICKLQCLPQASVVIPLDVSDTTEATINPTSLTYTILNWNIFQTVTVTGLDDFYADGNVSYNIKAVPTSSSDPLYNNQDFSNSFPLMTNLDNEIAAVSLFYHNITTSESGGSVSIMAHLQAMPQCTLVLPLTVNDSSEAKVSFPAPPTISVLPSAWSNNWTIVIVGVDDYVADGDVVYSLTVGPAVCAPSSGSDPSFVGVTSTLLMRNINDDQWGMSVSPTSGNTTEAGASASFSVKLLSSPLANVLVPIHVNSDCLDEITCSPSQMTFSSSTWSQLQVVSCRGLDDSVVDGDQHCILGFGPTSSKDSLYNNSETYVSVTNLDNDRADLSVSSSSAFTSESGLSATVTVSLSAAPISNEIITVYAVSSNTNEAVVSPSVVYFTSGTWSTSKQFTVQGVDDYIADGTVSYTLTLSASSNRSSSPFNGVVRNLPMFNNDNDIASVYCSDLTSSYTTEDGSVTSSFQLQLTSQPLATVTIPISVSPSSQAYISPSGSPTFSSQNWNIIQTFTIIETNDFIAEGNTSYTVQCGPVQSSDVKYDGINACTHSLMHIDNDKPGIFISPAPIPDGQLTIWRTTESGGNTLFTVCLLSQPDITVVLQIYVSDASEASSAPLSLWFDPSVWNIPQTVTIHGVDDSLSDGPILYTVSVSVLMGDQQYALLAPSVIHCLNVDNDVSDPFQVSIATANTTEIGGTAAIWVALDQPPSSGILLISVSSTDTTEGVVSPSQIVFSSSNWDYPQPVLIRGVDDFTDDGDTLYYIRFDSDSRKRTLPLIVPVWNINNDFASIYVSNITGATSELGEIWYFETCLTSQPLSPVVLNISALPSGVLVISPLTLNFTEGNWNIPVSVSVKGIRNALRYETSDTIFVSVKLTIDSEDPLYQQLLPVEITVSFRRITFPKVQSVWPNVAPLASEPGTYSLNGSNFVAGATVTVGAYSGIPSIWASSDILYFDAPTSTVGGYQNITVTNPDGGFGVLSPGILYTEDCPEPGFYGKGTDCHPCPRGAICPGGNRLWPDAGWWNEGEDCGWVVECRPHERCLGGRLSECSERYTGQFCGLCKDDYYQQGELCETCESWWIFILAGFYFIFLLLLLFALLNLDTRKVARLAWTLVLLQTIVVCGQMATENTPKFMTEAYTDITFGILDVGVFIRPACTLLPQSLTQIFFDTILVNALCLTFFVCGTLAYSFLVDPDLFERAIFSTVRTVMVYCAISYVTITTRALQGVDCQPFTQVGRSVLNWDRGTTCYEGTHVFVMLMSYAILLLFSVPFPIASFFLMWKFETRLDDVNVKPFFGFMYEVFETSSYYYGPLLLGFLFLLCAVNVLVSPYRLPQFLLSVALICLMLLLLMFRRIYTTRWEFFLSSSTLLVALFGVLCNFLSSFDTMPSVILYLVGIVHLGCIAGVVLAHIIFLIRFFIKPTDARSKSLVVFADEAQRPTTLTSGPASAVGIEMSALNTIRLPPAQSQLHHTAAFAQQQHQGAPAVSALPSVTRATAPPVLPSQPLVFMNTASLSKTQNPLVSTYAGERTSPQKSVRSHISELASSHYNGLFMEPEFVRPVGMTATVKMNNLDFHDDNNNSEPQSSSSSHSSGRSRSRSEQDEAYSSEDPESFSDEPEPYAEPPPRHARTSQLTPSKHSPTHSATMKLPEQRQPLPHHSPAASTTSYNNKPQVHLSRSQQIPNQPKNLPPILYPPPPVAHQPIIATTAPGPAGLSHSTSHHPPQFPSSSPTSLSHSMHTTGAPKKHNNLSATTGTKPAPTNNPLHHATTTTPHHQHKQQPHTSHNSKLPPLSHTVPANHNQQPSSKPQNHHTTTTNKPQHSVAFPQKPHNNTHINTTAATTTTTHKPNNNSKNKPKLQMSAVDAMYDTHRFSDNDDYEDNSYSSSS
ncbi:calcium-binding protein [Pelomyxa schiedti]|nr:calcium-binding protein [Pelomyxa schiedti]